MDFNGVVNRFSQNTGVGKTMLATALVNRFFELTTNNYYDERKNKYHSLGLVFSTCHMFKTGKNPFFREKDFYYTPLGILPLGFFDKFNQVYDVEIPIIAIFDDFDNNQMIMNKFFKTMTGYKRKYNMELYFIGHYDKDLVKSVRENTDFRYIIEIRDKKDIVGRVYQKKIVFDELGQQYEIEIPFDFELIDVFDDLKDMYDTKENVDKANSYTFEREMLNFCKGMNEKDLAETLSMFIGNKKEFDDKFEYFKEKLNIN